MDSLTVSVDVSNTGSMAGQEIVQVYVHDHKSQLVRPTKELKGFAKVALQPGETQTVSIDLDFRSFAYYHPGYQQWITEDGEFDILIGASSEDIRSTQTITLQSTQDLPSLLSRTSTVGEWLEDQRGARVLGPFLKNITDQMQMMLGEEGGELVGMDPMGFINDLPLTNLLHFFGGSLPTPPEEMIEAWLSQVDL